MQTTPQPELFDQAAHHSVVKQTAQSDVYGSQKRAEHPKPRPSMGKKPPINPRTKGSVFRIHTIRTKDGGRKTLKINRSMAIRCACMECLGWESDPKDCTSKLCPLYPYRKRTETSLKGDQS